MPSGPGPGRAPEPAVAAPAAAGPPDGAADPLMTVLPYGFWFHGAPAPAVPPGPLLGAAAAPGTPVLVVGRPDAPLPPVADVAAIATAAARLGPPGTSPADLLVSAPWAGTSALVTLTAVLAAALGREVRAAVGLPTRTAHGWSSRVLAADGAQAWEPWLTELTASPALGRVIASAWRPLPAAFAACGPALHQAPVAGWRLEAVPAGLWLRPEEPPSDRSPRLLDPDPARPTLIAGSADRTAPAEVLDILDDLVSALTDPGAPAPRLLLPGAPAVRRPHAAGPATPAPATPAPATPETPDSPSPQAGQCAPDSGSEPPVLPEPITPATAPTTMTESTTAPDSPTPRTSQAAPTPGPAAPETPDTPTPQTTLPPTGNDSESPSLPEPATPATAPTTTTESTTAPNSPAPQTSQATPSPESGTTLTPAPDPTGPETPNSPTPQAPQAPEAVRAIPRLLVPPAAAGRVSTAAERAAFRALLGAHFHRYASRAEQAALRMPALRAQARDDLKDDLAAVYLHHADTGIPVHRAELVEAARRSGAGDGPLACYLACLGSGLRRLPNHRGAVLLGAEAGEGVLGQYARGTLLVEPAPVVGTAEAEVVPGTDVEFLVWSATGRRTSVIAEDGDPEVVFPPGTHFLVLDVLPAGEDRPARVLLRESGPAAAPDEAGDEQDRARLGGARGGGGGGRGDGPGERGGGGGGG
ncbi:hypothetical protein BG452_43005, partial [Streptomyces sp. CBMA123]|nr:hypothetical protein [Streptomyces sp. CBMA123]